MTRWLVLLRGVNVSGHHKVPMAELRGVLAARGFTGVETYIQSGNIALDSAESPEDIVAIVEEELDLRFGVNVPVIVLDQSSVAAILAAAPFAPGSDPAFQLIYFADGLVDLDGIGSLDAERYAGDVITPAPNAVFVSYENGQSRSKLTLDALERAAGCTLTGRNVRSAAKLLEL